jgi:hypothetical protein
MFDGVATLSDMLNAHHSRFDAALKARWPQMTRAQRALVVDADRAALARRAAARDAAAPDFPFAAVADDHCETAYEALADVSLVLAALARAMGRSPASLRLYDPFYCAGASAEHLRALGFPLVHNAKEDFYATVRASQEPEFDVLVTNPAFSGDHMRHLLAYAAAAGKPFMLLMPNYVAGWPECRAAGFDPAGEAPAAPAGDARGGAHGTSGGAAFVYPPKRYVFWTPHGLRDKSKLQGHSSALLGSRTSPFVTFWYVGGLGENLEAVLAESTGPARRLRAAFTLDELPPSVRPPAIAGATTAAVVRAFDRATFGSAAAAVSVAAAQPEGAAAAAKQLSFVSSKRHWRSDD